MVVWAQVILYLFANKMIILKIELPLLNVDITPFLKNQIDLFVTKIENNWLDGHQLLVKEYQKYQRCI